MNNINEITITDTVKTEMINEAVKQFSNISPCGNRVCLDDCFTIDRNYVYFWFNDNENSTHIVERAIGELS